jgi:anti-sigma B factor antagonist
MKISTRQVDGITVIDARGRITLGDGDALLRETIGELLANNHRKLLLNLAEVSYIDSSGLGVLVGAYTTVRKQGGELQLLNLTKRVRNLLQITKLYTVFTVSDDETAAIKSWNMTPAIKLPVLVDPYGKAGLERAAQPNVVV